MVLKSNGCGVQVTLMVLSVTDMVLGSCDNSAVTVNKQVVDVHVKDKVYESVIRV
jgi:hypothetical protein